MSSYLGSATLWLALFAAFAELSFGGIRILSVEPTVLFPQGAPLRQIAIVSLLNDGDDTISCDLSAAVRAGEVGPKLGVQAVPGVSRHRVLVPDISAAAEVEFAVTAKGQTLAQRNESWQPQRKWKVFVVKSSHEDLGYEEYIFKKQHDIAEFIDLAGGLAGPQENMSDVERKGDARFHYTLETLLFQRNYIEERGQIAWRKLVDEQLKTGRMHLMGAPSGVHSHWMDYEQLARMTYPARREVKDRYGLDLKTFMIVDNPSLSWSGAQAVADAGFKYVARWGQGWRTGANNNYKTTKLPALFWWKAPDQEHQVLFGWRSHYGLSFWYGQTGGGYQNLIDMASEHVSKQLEKIQSGVELGPYPYDAVVNPEYVDHDTPRFDSRVLPAWKQQYAYPEIRIAGPTQFFEYIESKYGRELPVLSGDLNNFSADYATIDPESQDWKRRASRMLPFAESLGTIASLVNPKYLLSPAMVDRTYTRFFDYDEHCWPTLPPASEVQLFNAAWVKKEEAKRGLDATVGALREAVGEMGRNIATGAEPTVAIFNPLAHSRTGLVELDGSVPGLVDAVTGKAMSVQVRNGKTTFVASDVPALGYKLFLIRKAAAGSSSLGKTGSSISNEFYEVRFDPITGSVSSIVEKASGRELLDKKAPYQANQMIYVHKDTRESKAGFMHVPARAKRQESTVGPVSAEFKVWIDDDKTGAAILQTVTLYAGLKRIDFVNQLEHAKALYTDQHEERYRDNIFYAYPLQVDGGQFRVEYPGGVVRPHADQLRWGSHDYLYANRWVDVSNASHGITMAPWNAATFHLGEIRYNEFSIDYKPSSSHLYSYAWSNRMAGLLTLGPDDLNATLGYSLTSHDGDWNSGATTQFGWEVASPLHALRLPERQSGLWREAQKSFLGIEPRNVQMTVLKNSEQPGRGLILRLVETDGQQADFELDLKALGASQAYLCDLVENDKQELSVVNGRARMSLRPYSFATIRLEAKGEVPAKVTVQAAAVADDAIRLSWSGPAAAAYNVFRSVDPNDPPTPQTLVARASGTSFVDRGLHYKTRYYYQVAPIGAGNRQGSVAKADAETSGRNLAPPMPVDELGVIRRAKDKLMIYWRSNTEADVARYYLYRGETADFSLNGRKPLAVIEPAQYFLQLYIDTGLDAKHSYFYKVVAEDFAGNRQTQSPVATAVTPK
jgi:alpha-mannosidase